ncbi:TetR/AcrR family transcriptional regulator [Nocardioides dongkuii]|uniref:TetR/AcrR family transcriptional regulator n=1 Tax=Nocardioides dongkuii TaxID=2760089 RepID=UPI0015FA5F40|nr:TetR/AcrR family transcriptional regulator [Nocardioides dongkuii]
MDSFKATGLTPGSAPTRPGTGRQARAEATRSRIIDETVDCVLEQGFSAASAKHIAERAGVTWGVVQYHFGDRDGILAAVVEAGLVSLVDSMSSVEIPTGSLRERVEGLVEAGWNAYTSPLTRAGLEILVATRTARGATLESQLEPFGREVARLARTVLPEAGNAGRVLFLALRGLALDQLLHPTTRDSRADRAAIVEAVLCQLGDAAARD